MIQRIIIMGMFFCVFSGEAFFDFFKKNNTKEHDRPQKAPEKTYSFIAFLRDTNEKEEISLKQYLRELEIQEQKKLEEQKKIEMTLDRSFVLSQAKKELENEIDNEKSSSYRDSLTLKAYNKKK